MLPCISATIFRQNILHISICSSATATVVGVQKTPQRRSKRAVFFCKQSTVPQPQWGRSRKNIWYFASARGVSRQTQCWQSVRSVFLFWSDHLDRSLLLELLEEGNSGGGWAAFHLKISLDFVYHPFLLYLFLYSPSVFVFTFFICICIHIHLLYRRIFVFALSLLLTV